MKVLSALLLFSLIGFSTYAQKSSSDKEKKLLAYLDNKQFYAPSVGNYIEFHLQFVGYSLEYKGKDGGLIGELGIRMELTQGDEVVKTQAFRLETPFMKDSVVEDFYHVERFVLAPGTYKFSIELFDMNSEAEAMKASQMIVVDELGEAISLSDIEAAELATPGDGTSAFYKSGYDIIPRLVTYYPSQLNSIPIYFEIYNTAQLGDSIFGIRQTITDGGTSQILAQHTSVSKHEVADVVPFLREVDITNLPTGKFILNYTLISRNGTDLSTESYEFERGNDEPNPLMASEVILDPNFQASITDDSIGYYLECLIPISRANEVKNIIAISKSKDGDQARMHIQLYWNATAPGKPYEAWIKYKAQVGLVERSFRNNFQSGFETDRGRVYLQYGSPTNIIVRENNPMEYPYEIWQYNKIGNFSNKRFVFYNPDLVNNTHRLLHSDMVGELKNSGWQQTLSKRNTANGSSDDPNGAVQDQFGGNANEYFIGN
jgi:GWxTD domain-containing protein